MGFRKKALLVYENKHNADALSRHLRKDGFEVFATPSELEGLAYAEAYCPDICLVAAVLNDGDGIALLKAVREWSQMPVIVFSKRRGERTALEALNSGADDFIRLPCGAELIMARIRLAIRRYNSSNNFSVPENCYVLGELRVDCGGHRVFLSGRDIGLTQSEYRIIALLAKHSGSICTYGYILSQLWGPKFATDNEILRVNMTKIRRKFGGKEAASRYITTVKGVGYIMEESR